MSDNNHFEPVAEAARPQKGRRKTMRTVAKREFPNLAPTAKLRHYFADGLFGARGRYPAPIPQPTLANWCDVSQDTIASIEAGRMDVSDTTAERIHRISGAPKEWLRGQGPPDAFGYRNLCEWFPMTFREFPPLGQGRVPPPGDVPRKLAEFTFALRPVLELLVTAPAYTTIWTEARQLLETLLPKLGQAPQNPPATSATETWMAFAFAFQPEDLVIPKKLGLMNWVVEEAARMGHVIAADDYRKLQHMAIFLRGGYEREFHRKLTAASATTDQPSVQG